MSLRVEDRSDLPEQCVELLGLNREHDDIARGYGRPIVRPDAEARLGEVIELLRLSTREVDSFCGGETGGRPALRECPPEITPAEDGDRIQWASCCASPPG